MWLACRELRATGVLQGGLVGLCLLFGLIFFIVPSPPGKVSATAQSASFPPGATFLDLGNVDPKRGQGGKKSFLPFILFPLFLLSKRLGGDEAAKAARPLIVAEALGSICTADSSQPQLDRCTQPASAQEWSGPSPFSVQTAVLHRCRWINAAMGLPRLGSVDREQRQQQRQGCWLEIRTDEVLTAWGNERSDGKWGRLTPITDATCQKPACWAVAVSTNCVWIVNRWLDGTRGAREWRTRRHNRGQWLSFFFPWRVQ